MGRGTAAADLLGRCRQVSVAALSAGLQGVRIDPASRRLHDYLVQSMGALPDEALRILFLDPHGFLIADEEMQRGSLSHLAFYPRTIIRRALEHNAAGLILAHNHPSGDALPSEADLETTRQFGAVARSLDIRIVDHIIVTRSGVRRIGAAAASAPRARQAEGSALRSRGAADVALENAKSTLRRSILRKQLLGIPDLLGDPAWEMLVDLFIHERENRPLSITSFCTTPSIPLSSALRLCQKLCEAGVISRVPDLFDGRRSYLRLERGTAHRLDAYFGSALGEGVRI